MPGSNSSEGPGFEIYRDQESPDPSSVLISALASSISSLNVQGWTLPNSGGSASRISIGTEDYGNLQLLEQQGGCCVQIYKGFGETRQPETEQGFPWQDGSGIHQAWRKVQNAVLDLLQCGFSVPPFFNNIVSHLKPIYRNPCEGCHLALWPLDENFRDLDVIMRQLSPNFQTPAEQDTLRKWNSLQEAMGALQVHVQQLRAESGLTELPEDAVLRFVSSEQYPDGTSRVCAISERGCLLQVDEDTFQLR
jgi:hypothetical protein